MSWIYEEYVRMMQEAYARVDAAFSAYLNEPWPYGTPVEPVSNTFLANPVPREGYIDARRDDGCVPTITELVVL